jgi:hypothetical protein
MATWFHTTILATVFAATAAIGIASAALYINANAPAPKADRLPVIADAESYVTIETRQDGVSILERVQVR